MEPETNLCPLANCMHALYKVRAIPLVLPSHCRMPCVFSTMAFPYLLQVEIMQQLVGSDGAAVVDHVLPQRAGAPESIVKLVSELR